MSKSIKKLKKDIKGLSKKDMKKIMGGKKKKKWNGNGCGGIVPQ